MAPRPTTRPTRENDYSNIGVVGRKTGIVLPRGRVDENGMEEVTGLFSSPRKPSPLRKSLSSEETVPTTKIQTPRPIEQNKTPPTRYSTRKSALPKSASPRKSGIRGTARRSNAIEVLRHNEEDPIEEENALAPSRTPVLVPTTEVNAVNHSSPSKIPQRVLTRRQNALSSSSSRSTVRRTVKQSSARPVELHTQSETTPNATTTEIPHEAPPDNEAGDDYDLPPVLSENENVQDELNPVTDQPELVQPGLASDNDGIDQSLEHEATFLPRSREPTIANSRRKRKSDANEAETEPDAISSPAAKRAKRISDDTTRRTRKKQKPAPKLPSVVPDVTSKDQQSDKAPERIPLKNKGTNAKLTARQEKELEGVVKRIRARPGPTKSLYILRRETPADEGVTHTRSGRISVKPLAYWRNERCVFGGSPGGASLQDGARFPLNSIKEIIRTDVFDIAPKKSKAKRGQKTKKRDKGQELEVEEEGEDEDLPEEDLDEDDQFAEPWETEIGTFRGAVSVWDAEQQSAIQEEEDVDIAYAPGAIETREVKGSTFKYAKLLSTRFFGSGLVELPPGATKRPKNSRRMHMSFFCATGRVTVTVGPLNGPENKFSIGKGGFWQVPRGNQYSIANELNETATIFFSQACEPAPVDFEQ